VSTSNIYIASYFTKCQVERMKLPAYLLKKGAGLQVHASHNVADDCENLLKKTSDLSTVSFIFDELFVGFIERIREAIPARGIVHIFRLPIQRSLKKQVLSDPKRRFDRLISTGEPDTVPGCPSGVPPSDKYCRIGHCRNLIPDNSIFFGSWQSSAIRPVNGDGLINRTSHERTTMGPFRLVSLVER
jgi:hypothetical protein